MKGNDMPYRDINWGLPNTNGKGNGVIKMKKCQNKWVRAAIPALLLHCSIGTVYCWSLFSESIVNFFNEGSSAQVTKGTIE